MIRSHGRDFTNVTTSQTVRGFLSSDGPAQFAAGETISPGDLLQDMLEEKRYIVSDTARADGYTAVFLLPAHLACSITRLSSAVNAFGRPVNDPVTIASGIPISFKPGGKQAFLPAGVPVKAGDVLKVDGSEVYTVEVVSATCPPGLRLLAVVRHDANQLARLM